MGGRVREEGGGARGWVRADGCAGREERGGQDGSGEEHNTQNSDLPLDDCPVGIGFETIHDDLLDVHVGSRVYKGERKKKDVNVCLWISQWWN